MKLKVPLYAEGHVDDIGAGPSDFKQQLRLWRGGHVEYVDSPAPFFYTTWNPESDDTPDAVKGALIAPSVEKKKMVVPGEGESTWYKNTLPNELCTGYFKKRIREAGQRSDREAEEFLSYTSAMQPNNSGIMTRYVDQVLMSDPDHFRQYPTTEDLKVWIFDIEQWSKGEGFEETKKNPLISIAVTTKKGDAQTTHYFESKVTRDEQNRPIIVDDEQMIRDVIGLFKDFDPDVIVGFNQNGYDLPVFISRCKWHGLSVTFFDRLNEKEPYFKTQKLGVTQMDKCFIRGRVCFDVKHTVDADQTLNGEVKNRKLKTVAKHYKKVGVIPKHVVIEEEDMIVNTAIIGTDTLKKYNISDVVITMYLYEMYVKNVVAVAEFLGCPLNMVVPLATSYPYSIVAGRIYHENNMVTTGKNRDRNLKHWPNTGKPFEGAVSEAFKLGRYRNLTESDVSSLYPNIMVSLGIGPDNTRIVGTLPWDESKFVREYGQKPTRYYRAWAEKNGDVRTYYIPDQERKTIWQIEVKGYSRVAALAKEFLQERMRLKRLSKTADTEGERAAAFSRAYGLKVVLNSFYGGLGDAYNDYGQLGAAALITGMGRENIHRAIEFGGVDKILMVDTDSVKFPTGTVNEEELTEYCSGVFEKEFYGLPVITWEDEDFKAIYIHAAKNYLLLHMDDSISLHGVAYKSSRTPKLQDAVIAELAPEMLKHGHEETKKLALKYFSLRGLTNDDYILSVKLGKPIDEYKGNTLAKSVALAHQSEKGVTPKVGVQYEYIKVKNGYAPPSPLAFTKLDADYYRGIIDKAVAKLGYENVWNQTLLDFM